MADKRQELQLAGYIFKDMGEFNTWIVSPHGSAFFSSDAIDWAYKELMRYKEYEELSMMMKRAAIAGRDDFPFTQQAKDHMKKWEYLAPWQQQLAESEVSDE